MPGTYLLSQYAGLILPPAILHVSSTSPLSLHVSEITSRLRKVFAIPKSSLVEDVKGYAIPNVDLNHYPPALPFPKQNSYLALRESDQDSYLEFDLPSEPSPHSFTVSSTEGLAKLMTKRILPTLHFVLRSTLFNAPKGVGLTESALRRMMDDEERKWEYDWKEVDTGEENLSAYHWRSKHDKKPSALMVVIPGWILTPRLFARLVTPRQLSSTPSSASVSESSASVTKRKIDSILHHVYNLAVQTSSSHIILTTHNQWSFGHLHPSSNSIELSPPISYYSSSREFRPPQKLSFPPGPSQVEVESMLAMPPASEVSVLEAACSWLSDVTSVTEPTGLPTPSPTTNASPLPPTRKRGRARSVDPIGSPLKKQKGRYDEVDEGAETELDEDEDEVVEVKPTLRRSARLRGMQSVVVTGTTASKTLKKTTTSVVSKKTTSKTVKAAPKPEPKGKGKAKALTAPVPAPAKKPKAPSRKRRRDDEEVGEGVVGTNKAHPSPSKKSRMMPPAPASRLLSPIPLAYHRPRPKVPLGPSETYTDLLNIAPWNSARSDVNGAYRTPPPVVKQEEHERVMPDVGELAMLALEAEGKRRTPPVPSESELRGMVGATAHLTDPRCMGSLLRSGR